MMEAMFKKEDIKAGYLLRFWDKREDRYVNMTVAPMTGLGLPAFLTGLLGEIVCKKDGELACCGEGHFWPLDTVNGDLTCADGQFRVDEIYGYTAPAFLLDNTTRKRELLWKRGEGENERCDRCRCDESRDEAEENCTCDEPVEAAPVKLTIDEICQRLGYQVEIAEDATASGGDCCGE